MSLRLSGGRRLHSPPGDIARPTPSRVRLAVMNMLAAELQGCHWLDLFCGSGVMGCEALQRGAATVVAVDQQRSMAAISRTNLELTASAQTKPPSVEVVCQDVLRWLDRGRPAQEQPFHVIYADPPYSAGLYGPVAAAVKQGDWVNNNGAMLLECSSTALPDLTNEAFKGWKLAKQKRYGSSTVLVLLPR